MAVGRTKPLPAMERRRGWTFHNTTSSTSSPICIWGECADFQILRETKRLAGFIYWVAEQRPGGRVALVLNGDVVDTLAEEIGGYIAVNNAVAAVERIIKDNSFAQVWEASHFRTKPNRTLDVVIGNHDIERARCAGSASHPLAARRR